MPPTKSSRRPRQANVAPPRESMFLRLLGQPQFSESFWLYVSHAMFNTADDLTALLCFLALRYEFFCFLEPKAGIPISMLGALLFLIQVRRSFRMTNLMRTFYLENLYYSQVYFSIFERVPPLVLRVKMHAARIVMCLCEWMSIFAITLFAAFPVDCIMAANRGCALRPNVVFCLVLSIITTYFNRKLQRAGASIYECREALVIITTYITAVAVFRDFGGAQRIAYPRSINCLLTSASTTSVLFRLTGVGFASIAKVVARHNNGQLTPSEYNNLKGNLITTLLHLLLSRLFYHAHRFVSCLLGRNEL